MPPAEHDYSHEVNLVRSHVMRRLLIVAGTISLGLGILGIFLPVLPTTPFLLLAAACYARASVTFYNWLMNNRFFGRYIRDWRIHKAVPRRAKVAAVSLILLTVGYSVWFVIPLTAVKILVGLTGAGVIVYLLRMPTRRTGTEDEHVGAVVQADDQSPPKIMITPPRKPKARQSRPSRRAGSSPRKKRS